MVDHLVVAIDVPKKLVRTSLIKKNLLRLSDQDLQQIPMQTMFDVWGCTQSDVEELSKHVQSFLIDPDLWKDCCMYIKWPEPKNFITVSDTNTNAECLTFMRERSAIERCKLAVYKACRMSPFQFHPRGLLLMKRFQDDVASLKTIFYDMTE